MEKILILVSICGIIMLCIYLKQDWSSPATLNALWNSFFIILSILFFGEMIQWEYGGVIWLLLSCIAFLIGQIIGDKVESHRYKNYLIKEHKKITNIAPLAIFFLILIGMLNPIIYLKAFGYSVTDLFNVNVLLSINAEIAADRYSGNGFENGLVVIIGAITYCTALCGGYMFGNCKKWISKLCMVMTIFPMMFLTIITNAKVGTIAVVFLWVIGWLLSYIDRNRKGVHISKKLFLCICGGAIASFLILYLSMMLRIGSLDRSTKLIVDDKMQEYAFGHIEAFTEWFHLRDYFHYDLGSNTYMVIARYLGLTERLQGVYAPLEGVSSNIFTQNRGIIQDFGMIGGLLFWMLFGVIGGWCYKNIKKYGRQKKICMTILAFVYFTIFYGFIISPWIYTSYTVAIVGFCIFLYLLDIVGISIKGEMKNEKSSHKCYDYNGIGKDTGVR